MTLHRILLVANGDCAAATLARCLTWQPRMILCVDGGLRHCTSAGIEPDVLLGDFDSADPLLVAQVDKHKTRCIQHPEDKDATDLELALRYVETEVKTEFIEGAEKADNVSPVPQIEVLLAGLSGGRTDHMLANWLLLAKADWSFAITVMDQCGDGFFVSPNSAREIAVTPGDTFSLLALRHASGVNCDGARYPLKNAELETHTSLGISNVAESTSVKVSVEDGALLMYVNAIEDKPTGVT